MSVRSLCAAFLVAASAAVPVARAAGPAPKVRRAFARWLESEAGTVPAKVRLLSRNVDAWYARWYLLGRAQESIDLTYFNFSPDLFGKSFLGLLRAKAEAGVKVRLLVDTRGAFSLAHQLTGQRYLSDLAAHPNIEVRTYRAFHKVLQALPKSLRDFVAGNHDKILVVDGEAAVTGGRNMGAHYFSDPADDPKAFVDHDVMIEGPEVVAQLREAFEAEFDGLKNFHLKKALKIGWKPKLAQLELHRRGMNRWLHGEGVLPEAPAGLEKTLEKMNRALGKYPRMTAYWDFASAPFAGATVVPCRVLDKTSRVGHDDITPNLLRLIDAAEHRILIQNAYLVLTAETLAAFERAAARGVEIQFHTNSPASTSNILVQAYFIRDWKEWMRRVPSLEIYMATARHKIHSKVFVIDDQVTLIGSYNIDPMSQSLNSEVVTLIDDAGFAAAARESVLRTLPGAVRCEIRVEPDGAVTGLVGPDDYVGRFKGLLLKFIGSLDWLRPLV